VEGKQMSISIIVNEPNNCVRFDEICHDWQYVKAQKSSKLSHALYV